MPEYLTRFVDVVPGILIYLICIFNLSASMGIPVQPLPDYQDGAEKVRVLC